MVKTWWTMVAVLLLGATVAAKADPVAISTNTPANVVALVDGYHILDNLTPATFYDFNKMQWMAGGTTAVYKKYWTSLDLGVVQSLKNGSEPALLMGGFRLHLGQLLMDKVQLVHDLASKEFIAKGLLKYSTGGGWVAKNWNDGSVIGGLYTGFEIKF